MNTLQEIERDAAVLDKFIVMYAGSCVQDGFVKEAQLFDGAADAIINFFSDAAKAVMEEIKQTIEKEGWFSIATFLSYAVAGVPWSLILLAVELVFGITPGSFIKSLGEKADTVVSEMAESNNGEFSENMVDQAADRILGSLGASASLDFFHDLEKNGEMLSFISKNKITKEASKAGFIRNIFRKILGRNSRYISRNKKRSLVGGMLRWGLKVILLPLAIAWGALKGGLKFGVPHAGASYVGLKDKPGEDSEEEASSFYLPSRASHNLKQNPNIKIETFLNDANHDWVVNLVQGDIKKTLLYWAVNIYPELKEKANELMNSASFNKMASILSSGYEPRWPNSLIMPKHRNLTSWKAVVDYSIGDVV